MGNQILAYDLGTGGVKASVFDESGKSIAECFVSYDTRYPQSGYHEQNPLDWWQAVVTSTRRLLQSPSLDGGDILCLAVSGHSLGVVPVGRDGELLSQQIPIWSDSRAVQQAQDFFTRISTDEWYLTTGNGFPPALYSIFKLMWMKEHLPEMYAKTAKFIGTKDYINYRLTGRLCTDPSYASGSGVYDLKAWDYRQEYIENSGVAAEKLPEIAPSTTLLGKILPEVARELGLGENVQVACGGVDNACMALGAGCVADGMAYTSLGSSAWIAVSGHEPIVDVRYKPYVFTHCIPGMFVSSAAIFSAGSSFRWLRDTVCRDLLGEKEPYDAMTRLAAQSPLGANRLIFNPSLAGGSSLDKSPQIKGGWIGLQLGHTQSDLIRAVMEGICLNLRIALDVMAGYTALSEDMLLVGGGGRSQFWRSLFADTYNKNILETNVGQDAGSLGAAAVAAVGVGLWKDFNLVPRLHVTKSRVEPVKENSARYSTILRLFKRIAEVQAEIGEMIEQTEWE
jgi:xylulokinase